MAGDRGHQRGVALIMALLVVALATIVAVAIAVRADAEFRRAETALHLEQAMQYVFGAEQWVIQILRRDRAESEHDFLAETWASELPPLPVDGGTVTGRVEDLNGRFNLTNLVADDGSASAPDVAMFERMLRILGMDDGLRPGTVIDFIDAGQTPNADGGAEDAVYLGAEPPRRTPDRPLTTVSELALLDGFDPDLLAVIAPHVVTLPVRTVLNVNTLDAVNLMALVDGLPEPGAEAAVADAREIPYESVERFRSSFGVQAETGVALGLSSDWFRLSVEVVIGTTTLRMYSLLERAPDGRIRVVARSRTPW